MGKRISIGKFDLIKRRWRTTAYSGAPPKAVGGQSSKYMFFVYVLKSLKDGKHYIGSTDDIDRRLSQHNRGANTSTRNRRPFELIYSESYPTQEEAVAREYKLKRYKGGDAFKKLINK